MGTFTIKDKSELSYIYENGKIKKWSLKNNWNFEWTLLLCFCISFTYFINVL